MVALRVSRFAFRVSIFRAKGERRTGRTRRTRRLLSKRFNEGYTHELNSGSLAIAPDGAVVATFEEYWSDDVVVDFGLDLGVAQGAGFVLHQGSAF